MEAQKDCLQARQKDRLATRRLEHEERDMMFRVYPSKFHIANYWLEEKTTEMRAQRLKYKFIRTEDPQDPEVVLHLFKRSKRRRREIDQGEVGDLYTVELYLPSGGSVEIHIVAERSKLYYSVFDVGHQEHVYTVSYRAKPGRTGSYSGQMKRA